MSQRFDYYFMNVAEETAKLSYARRLQVGSVIVKDKNIISFGYNGTPAGWDNNCENEIVDTHESTQIPGAIGHSVTLKTKPEVLHSETNSIAKLARSTNSGEGASIYITHAPCLDCAKLIYQSGINSVYYRNAYRDTDGIEFLEKSNIKVNKI